MGRGQTKLAEWDRTNANEHSRLSCSVPSASVYRLSRESVSRRLILAGGEVGRFRDPARPYLHLEVIDIALDIDRYDFAVRVDCENGRPVARMERPA